MRPRDYVRIIAVLLLGFGVLCVPIGFGASPKRDTSAFANWADLGAVAWLALILIPSGILLFFLSYIRDRGDG